jgi:hypothetical protein
MWSMPRPILQLVAAAVASCGAIGFVLGLNSATPRPRLPGEAAAPAEGEAGAIAEARPVLDEPPPPKPEEETPIVKAEAPKPKAEPTPEPLLMQPVDGTGQQDPVGQILETVSPPVEEPPH